MKPLQREEPESVFLSPDPGHAPGDETDRHRGVQPGRHRRGDLQEILEDHTERGEGCEQGLDVPRIKDEVGKDGEPDHDDPRTATGTLKRHRSGPPSHRPGIPKEG